MPTTKVTTSRTRYLKRDLAEATGLSLDKIAQLILLGLFPLADCDLSIGPSWDKDSVDQFSRESARWAELDAVIADGASSNLMAVR